MTRTAPAPDRVGGAAADDGTLRALELPAIVEQLAAVTAFEPSRELALAALPMADAKHVALLQDQTDEADRLLAEQAQASIGGARDVRAALERASRGGRLTSEELLDIGETLIATERFEVRLNRGPDRSSPACAMSWTRRRRLAKQIGRSIDESGELLDTASSSPPPSASVSEPRRTAFATASTPCSARARWPESSASRSSPCAPAATSSPSAPSRAARSRASCTTSPPRAPRCSSSRSRWSRWATPGGGNAGREARGGAHPRRALRGRRGADDVAGRLTRGAGQGRPAIAPARPARRWTPCARPSSADAGELLIGARHPLPARTAVPIDVRLGDGFTAPRHHRPEHRRQDGDAQDDRAAVPDGPVRPARPGRRGQRGPGLPPRPGRHRRRAEPGAVAVDVLGHLRNVVRIRRTCRRPSHRWCCSTSSAPGPTRPEGAALRGPSSTTSHRRRAIVPTTHLGELKTYAFTRPGRERGGRVRRRTAAADLPPDDRPAGRATPSPSPNGSACRPEVLRARDRISADHASARGDAGRARSRRPGRQQASATRGEHSAERATAADEREARRANRACGPGRGREAAARLLAEARRRAADGIVARAEREVADLRREMTRQRNLAGEPARRDRGRASPPSSRQAARARTGTELPPDPLFALDADPAPEAGPAAARRPLRAQSRTLGSHRPHRRDQRAHRPRSRSRHEGARLVVPADDRRRRARADQRPGAARPRGRGADAPAQRPSACRPRSTSTDERVEAALERPHRATSTTPCSPASTSVAIVHGVGTGAHPARGARRPAPSTRASERLPRAASKDEGGDGATVAEL